jgi:exosome complex component RRP45
MPREVELSINERAFTLEALQEGIRADGRQFDQYRPISLNFGDEYGVVDLSLGKTRLKCRYICRAKTNNTRIAVRVSCEVTTPYAERKFDGIFNISCEFSPMMNPAFEVGRYFMLFN